MGRAALFCNGENGWLASGKLNCYLCACPTCGLNNSSIVSELQHAAISTNTFNVEII